MQDYTKIGRWFQVEIKQNGISGQLKIELNVMRLQDLNNQLVFPKRIHSK